eukprot:5345243-Heterocapsa_arctica.AAC.1
MPRRPYIVLPSGWHVVSGVLPVPIVLPLAADADTSTAGSSIDKGMFKGDSGKGKGGSSTGKDDSGKGKAGSSTDKG